MTYTLKIWYARTSRDSPQVDSKLNKSQVQEAVGALTRDLVMLGGDGVKRFCVEAEGD